MSKNRFEGWYFKHQANGKSLALIPGRASDEAFILVVTDNASYHIKFPLHEYHLYDKGKHSFHLTVGGNIFSPTGIILDIHRTELALSGEIAYANLTPTHSDIMGPFKYFPMECRHGIISMTHSLYGNVVLNADQQDYTGGKGYIESDSGRSFPSGYAWIQCNNFEADSSPDCSIMAAIARIPFCGFRFWGCICAVRLGGREYRLATYKGVRILRCEHGAIVLKQGQYQLDIKIQPQAGHRLPAPHNGKMSHFIRENLACPAQFRFLEGDKCLFDSRSNYASYEFAMS